MNQLIASKDFAGAGSLPTLVLVDLQEEHLQLPHARMALAHCRDALEHARLMGMPVAYTRLVGASWIKGFEPHGSDAIFERQRPSSYAGAHFDEVMASHDGHFVMAGFAGEVACLSTAIDAFHRSHRVTFLSDASASHALPGKAAGEVHDFVCQLMGQWGDVMRTENWIETTSHVVAWREAVMFGDRT